MKYLRVKDWAKNFENNRTRDMKKMQWIPVPNSHDGSGYTELVDHENGAAHLGCWLAILQVASKSEIRGSLLRKDARTPINLRSISRITRLDEEILKEAVTRLMSPEIGWLEEVELKELTENNAQDCGNPAPCPHPTDEEGKGMEGNGMKGTEGTEEKFPHLMAELQKNPTIQTAKAAIRSSHEAFRSVSDMHIENSLAGQPDKSRWAPAIQGMAAKFAGAEMKFPNRVLQNWLAGKPEQQSSGRRSTI